jgi:demethylmenaquinone methyltransferase/2-methoxy-6-polyprenyl-1,4-benzoquinol methylase
MNPATHNNTYTEVKPYGDTGMTKKQEVARMFDNISHRYDFLNHLLSMGIDKGWRNTAVKMLGNRQHSHILDIATGTGDFALAAMKSNPDKITGIDISEGMLAKGREKIKEKRLEKVIELKLADSENIPFGNQTFDAAIVAFGVRNFENLDAGLAEIYRVLKPGGQFIVLEFSKPKTFPVKQLYWFYFRYVLPGIGRLVSKDQAAYSYLPDSVNVFPDGQAFLQRLDKAGFTNYKQKPLTFGIASIYSGLKSEE